MTICPCCGAKNHDWAIGCACGARSVGEPLPRPQHELPSYGRSLALVVTGALTVLVFVLQTVAAFAQKLPTEKTYRETFSAASVAAIDLWAWIAAAETAAWKLKWVAIPFTLFVLFGLRKLYRSVKGSPEKFCGLRYARRGYVAAGVVPVLVAILIGLTVPVRWERHQWGVEAAGNIAWRRIDVALDQYHKQFETLPSELKDLKRLPDSDGTLAEALNEIDSSAYKPTAELASAPAKQPRPLRGAVISNASVETSTAGPLDDGLSFTNYELTLPGYDKKVGTEDDLIVRDGVLYKVSELPRRAGASNVSSAPKP